MMERNQQVDEDNVNEEDLVEVETGSILEDEEPPADEEMDEDVDNEGEEDAMSEAEVIEDHSYFTFRMHTDSVYCIAMHPTIPNLILTGNLIYSCLPNLSYLLCLQVESTTEPFCGKCLDN